MSKIFDALNRTTQSFFGESVEYRQAIDSDPITLKAIFSMQWIETNSVSTYSLTCDVLLTDISSSPGKQSTIKRGSKTYKIETSQLNDTETIYTLILKG